MPVRSFLIEDLLDYDPDDQESKSIQPEDNQQDLEVIEVDDDFQEPSSSLANRNVNIATDRKNKERSQHSEGSSRFELMTLKTIVYYFESSAITNLHTCGCQVLWILATQETHPNSFHRFFY